MVGMRQFSRRQLPAFVFALVASAGCGDDTRLGLGGEPPPNNFDCIIPIEEISSAALRDAIPALTNPAMVSFSDPGAAYLVDDDRVISLEINNFRVAVPLNVLWWHEIVNLDVGLVQLAVTHCPLTGSSLVFDRRPLGGVEFGVSGLLWQTNLMMYDRVNEDSLWPQLARGARCGPKTGQELTMLPAIEMRWGEYKQTFPGALVLLGELFGVDVEYQRYPYGPDYRSYFNPQGVPDGTDASRPPKERVLGIPTAEGGIAFPFNELEALGSHAVVDVPEEEMVVFWHGGAEAAMAFSHVLDGQDLSFRVSEDGITDEGTGSLWQINGEAVDGPLKGRRLDPVAEAHVSYWFGWSAFNPSTTIWSR